MARRIVRWLGMAVLVIGYPLLAHYTNDSAHGRNLGAPVAITPVVLIALALAWRSPRRFIMVGAVVLVCIALWAGWSALENNFGLVYWLEHVGIQLILFMTFGRTLIAGRQPLCARFAEAVHAPVTPQHEIYARRVTIAWTLFFIVMALASTMALILATSPLYSASVILLPSAL